VRLNAIIAQVGTVAFTTLFHLVAVSGSQAFEVRLSYQLAANTVIIPRIAIETNIQIQCFIQFLK